MIPTIKNRSGFTLIETIIYSALLSGLITVSCFSLVSFSTFSQYMDVRITQELETNFLMLSET